MSQIHHACKKSVDAAPDDARACPHHPGLEKLLWVWLISIKTITDNIVPNEIA